MASVRRINGVCVKWQEKIDAEHPQMQRFFFLVFAYDQITFEWLTQTNKTLRRSLYV